MRVRRKSAEYTNPEPPHDLTAMPDPKYWGDMEISQRVKDVKTDTDAIWKSLAVSFLVAVGCSLLGVVMSPVVRPIDLFFWVIPLIGMWVTIALIRVFLSGDISLSNMFHHIVFPPVALLSGLLLGEFLGRRSPTIYFLAIAVALILVLAVRILLGFYREWMITDPKMSATDRRLLREIGVGPNYPLLAVIVMLALIGPIFSIWISAILAVGLVLFGLFFGRTDPDSFNRFLTHFKEMLAMSYNYPVDGPVAPGVWVPKHPTLVRRCALFGGVLVTTLFLATAFYAFLPWDFPPLRSTFAVTFQDKLYGSWIEPNSNEALERHLGTIPEQYDPTPERKDLQRRAMEATPAQAKALLAEGEGIDRKVRENEAEIAAFSGTFLETFPLGWFLVSLAGFSEHPLFYGFTWFWSVAFTFAFVPGLLLALFRDPFEQILVYHPRLKSVDDHDPKTTLWDWYDAKLRNSTHEAPDPKNPDIVVRECDHLLLGFDPWTDYPILLHKPLIDQSHIYIGGGTGSGKTTRAMSSLFTPLIRTRRDRNGDKQPMPPMVFIDLKGDDTLLKKVITETSRRAEEDGREMKDVFRFFTTEPGVPTNRFNPFTTFKREGGSPIQLAQVLLEALYINYGKGYGKGYFSARNRNLLKFVLENHDPYSFREIDEILRSKRMRGFASEKEIYDAFELVEAMNALSGYDQLVTQPGEEWTAPDVIHMDSVLENRQIVYFYLQSPFESTTSHEIANLAVFALYSALVQRRSRKLPPIRSHLFIDEFQRLAGPQFASILDQARSAGMTAVLSNQSLDRLDDPDINLKHNLGSNTKLRIHMSINDYESMREISASSGEEMYETQSYSESIQNTAEGVFRSWTYSKADAKKPRITIDDIREYSSDPNMMICDLSGTSGYSQYKGKIIPIRTIPVLPWEPEEERTLSHMPTPEQIGVTEKEITRNSHDDVDRQMRVNLKESRGRLNEKFKDLPDDLPDIHD